MTSISFASTQILTATKMKLSQQRLMQQQVSFKGENDDDKKPETYFKYLGINELENYVPVGKSGPNAGRKNVEIDGITLDFSGIEAILTEALSGAIEESIDIGELVKEFGGGEMAAKIEAQKKSPMFKVKLAIAKAQMNVLRRAIDSYNLLQDLKKYPEATKAKIKDIVQVYTEAVQGKAEDYKKSSKAILKKAGDQVQDIKDYPAAYMQLIALLAEELAQKANPQKEE